jgi:hypothetical protein
LSSPSMRLTPQKRREYTGPFVRRARPCTAYHRAVPPGAGYDTHACSNELNDTSLARRPAG